MSTKLPQIAAITLCLALVVSGVAVPAQELKEDALRLEIDRLQTLATEIHTGGDHEVFGDLLDTLKSLAKLREKALQAGQEVEWASTEVRQVLDTLREALRVETTEQELADVHLKLARYLVEAEEASAMAPEVVHQALKLASRHTRRGLRDRGVELPQEDSMIHPHFESATACQCSRSYFNCLDWVYTFYNTCLSAGIPHAQCDAWLSEDLAACDQAFDTCLCRCYGSFCE